MEILGRSSQGESMTISKIKSDLASLANPEIAAHSSRFFKTGPGQYGEGARP